MSVELSPRQKLENLTEQQRQILHLYCQGLEQAEIGERLNYSTNTIKTYLREIRSVLGIDVDTNTKLRAIIYTEYCPELKQLRLSLEIEESRVIHSDELETRTVPEDGVERWVRLFTLLPTQLLRWVAAGVLSFVLLWVGLFVILGVLIGQNSSRSNAEIPVGPVEIVVPTEVFEALMVEPSTVQATTDYSQSQAVVTNNKGLLIDDFEENIDEWFAARDDWGPNEVALNVHQSSDAAVGEGALQCDFNFNLTDDYDPRATCFRVNLPIQDWTPYGTLQFQAKSLVDPSSNIRVFVALATGIDSCWNELGDFQKLGTEYQTFSFELDQPLYKNCIDFGNYEKMLIGKAEVVRFHLIFTAEHKPSGAVLVDNIRLLN
jgi:DNA-binding CsgD family transcriptional regulator